MRRFPKEPLVDFLREFWRRFQRDDCLTRASALAFNTIFALLPLALLGLAALGLIVGDADAATERLAKYLAQFVPGPAGLKTVRALLEQANVADAARSLIEGSVVTGAIAVLTQLWAGTGILVATTVPMNLIWGVKETRNIFWLRIRALGVFLAVAALFLVSLPLSAGPELLRGIQFPVFGGIPDPTPVLISLVLKLLALALGAALFALLYRFLPATRVPARAAWIGGAIASVLWELFKTAFAAYLRIAGSGNKLYGAFGGLAFLITWIGYTCTLLLAGAVVCRLVAERSGKRPAPAASNSKASSIAASP